MSKNQKLNYGIGATKLVSCFKLAKKLDLMGELYLKREDTNPTYSYKDRSMSCWIELILKKNPSANFVISSSGNAAVAAAASCIVAGRPLDIYISKNVEKEKYWRLKKLLEGKLKVGRWPFKSLAVNLQKHSIEEIKDQLKIVKQKEIDPIFKELSSGINIIQTDKPKKEAMLVAKEQGKVNLRGSMDDSAAMGYESIAYELFDQLKGNPTDIFFPSSSGTAVIGIYAGFLELREKEEMKDLPRFHVCQTEQVHTLIQNIANRGKVVTHNSQTQDSIASAICDRIGFRRKQIENIIKETKGSGLILNNQEIRNALFLMKNYGQESGVEGGLAMAGIIKAQEIGLELGGRVVCLITGR